MAPDGKSLITAVGSEDNTVWLHDNDGDHQISSEGSATAPSFSLDGDRLYYLMADGHNPDYELWVKDLRDGKIERLLPGYSMGDYSISKDGKEVVFVMNDQSGRNSLWVAPTSRRSSPVRVSSTAIEDSPFFLPDGDLVFRAVEGGSNYLYRMESDGSGRRKISSEPVIDVLAASPDGRWIVAASPSPNEEHTVATRAFAVDGSEAVTLCLDYCQFRWDTTGKFVYVGLHESTYAIPVLHDSRLPKVPSGGIAQIDYLTNPKNAAAMPQIVDSALSPSVYAYTRHNTRRNLYRIPLQ
jgi:hypothetical protein